MLPWAEGWVEEWAARRQSAVTSWSPKYDCSRVSSSRVGLRLAWYRFLSLSRSLSLCPLLLLLLFVLWS
jgi:hypothetical protein